MQLRSMAVISKFSVLSAQARPWLVDKFSLLMTHGGRTISRFYWLAHIPGFKNGSAGIPQKTSQDRQRLVANFSLLMTGNLQILQLAHIPGFKNGSAGIPQKAPHTVSAHSIRVSALIVRQQCG